MRVNMTSVQTCSWLYMKVVVIFPATEKQLNLKPLNYFAYITFLECNRLPTNDEFKSCYYVRFIGPPREITRDSNRCWHHLNRYPDIQRDNDRSPRRSSVWTLFKFCVNTLQILCEHPSNPFKSDCQLWRRAAQNRPTSRAAATTILQDVLRVQLSNH